MRKKRLMIMLPAVVLLAAASVWMLLAFHNSADSPVAEERPVRVALSLAEGANQWSNAFYEELFAAADRNEMELIYDEPEENTADWQRENVRELLAQDVDYLIFLPHDTEIVQQIAEQAKDVGVKTILVSGDKSANPYCEATVSIDFALEGKLCAQMLAEQSSGAICRVLEIRGPENSQIAAARAEGFETEIANYPNLAITAHVQGSNSRVASNNAVAEYISSNYATAPFDAVFACSDDDGLGALQALRNAGLRPGKDVCIVSVNATQDALKAIAAGEYTATVRSGKYIGETLFAIVNRMEAGDFSSRFFVLPSRIFSVDTKLFWLQDAMWS